MQNDRDDTDHTNDTNTNAEHFSPTKNGDGSTSDTVSQLKDPPAIVLEKKINGTDTKEDSVVVDDIEVEAEAVPTYIKLTSVLVLVIFCGLISGLLVVFLPSNESRFTFSPTHSP